MAEVEEPNRLPARLTISDIPNEILTQIFLEGTNEWKDTRPLDQPFPILVSATCFHWRLLAQSTPGLWTFIIPQLQRERSDCLRWTSEWLENSAFLPISVVLDDRLARSRHSADEATKLVAEILALVIQNVDRLQRLDMSAVTTKTLENSTHLLLNAPILQQVSLCFRDTNSTTSFSTSAENKLNWLLSLASLSKLRIESIVSPTPCNLTSLTAHKLRIGYQDTRNLFSTCPRLTHLVLHDLVPVILPVPFGYTLIQADSVRSLAINSHGIDERGAIYFLEFLIIPNLRYLEVDGNTRVSSILGSSIASSNITKLRISNCSRFFFLSHPTNSERDIKFYHSLTTIRQLELIHAPTKGLISSLNDTRGHNPSWMRPIKVPNAGSSEAGIVEPHITLDSPSLAPQLNDVPWPELRIITLDTLIPGDVVRLIDFVKVHKSVKSVELSISAAFHLSENLRLQGDTIFQIRSPGADDRSKEDVYVWLSRLVDIKRLQSYKYGLLDGDRAFLWEML